MNKLRHNHFTRSQFMKLSFMKIDTKREVCLAAAPLWWGAQGRMDLSSKSHIDGKHMK